MNLEKFFKIKVDNQKNIPKISNPSKYEAFEKLYLRVRKKEKRLISDQGLKKLPYVDPSHRYYKEWKIREKSMKRLIQYFQNKKLTINQILLDIGCGNGWLSYQLSKNLNITILGVDINYQELNQANRVFKSNNLFFLYYNVLEDLILPDAFDFVLLASSIQYFSNIQKLFSILLKISKSNSEIHILDSPIYRKDEVRSARRRSEKYYNELNNTEMNEHYNHHDLSELASYNPKIKYSGKSWIDNIFDRIGLSRYNSPFPWLIIEKN